VHGHTSTAQSAQPSAAQIAEPPRAAMAMIGNGMSVVGVMAVLPVPVCRPVEP
jgi:hypothetical protein